MRKKWRLSSSSGDFVFLHPESLFPREIETCDPDKLAPTLDLWLKDKPSRQSLLEILSSLEASRAKNFSSPFSTDEVKKGIIEALHGKQIVVLRIPRSFLKQSNSEAPSAEDAPPPARPLTPSKTEKKTVWVEFRVVDDATGEPVSGVELQIFLPENQEVVQATDKGGQINLEDVAPGTCRVTSVLSGATLARTVGFVQMGTKPSAGGANPSPTSAPLKMSGARIAEVSVHRVKTSDTLGALAKANKISEQDLEFFNFGTTDPEEINRYLRDRVGCTKKTRDGRNYLFDSADKPGLIYLPKPWKKDGLATEQTHTIRVKRLAGFYVILENE